MIDRDKPEALPVKREGGMIDTPHEFFARVVIILVLSLLLPPYVWLARNLWEWALT